MDVVPLVGQVVRGDGVTRELLLGSPSDTEQGAPEAVEVVEVGPRRDLLESSDRVPLAELADPSVSDERPHEAGEVALVAEVIQVRVEVAEAL